MSGGPCAPIPSGATRSRTDYPFQRQGWKIHVSATPLSALLVLSRCARVVATRGYAFKFAPDLSRLLDLLARESDRGSAGKFLTVYPDGAADVVELADILHQVTVGLPGPQILSDRQYRPGSLVHLRYGVHVAEPTLTDDGELRTRLVAPDGSLVPDRREAWFTRPDWVDDLVVLAEDDDDDPRLNGRYRVHTAIQHANKGGVFQAVDERDNTEVIVKQARAHVGATLAGEDSHTLLRAEAEALDILHPHGLCPRKVDLFTMGDSLFLVEEALTGQTLTDWVLEHDTVAIEDVLPMAQRIIDVVDRVHAAGLRLGDLAPNNLMVGDDRSVRCIDLEGAGRFGTPAAPIGTPGYFPAELRHLAIERADPGVTGDLYALGAVLFFLVTGADPVLLEGDDGARSDRLARLLEVLGPSEAARRLGPAILGLMADDPMRRWSLDRVRSRLARGHAAVWIGRAVSPRAVLVDLLAQLAEEAVAGAVGDHAASDPRTVYAGAAGRLAVLTRVDPHSPAVDALLPRLYADAPAGPVLPGLFTGVAGVAWAGYDAARLRGESTDRALELARQVPTSWHVPDVCHGLAGAGLAFAHLWRRGAGEEFRIRVAECAENLAKAAVDTNHGLMWTFPPGADSALAGQATYGFAHGVAGIGTFLLTAGSVTGDCRYRELAIRAGQTLAANVRGDDRFAWWYADPTSRNAATRRSRRPTGATEHPVWGRSCSGWAWPPPTTAGSRWPAGRRRPYGGRRAVRRPATATGWPGTGTSCSTWPTSWGSTGTGSGPRSWRTSSPRRRPRAAVGSWWRTRRGSR
jgi:hypothetical protein